MASEHLVFDHEQVRIHGFELYEGTATALDVRTVIAGMPHDVKDGLRVHEVSFGRSHQAHGGPGDDVPELLTRLRATDTDASESALEQLASLPTRQRTTGRARSGSPTRWHDSSTGDSERARPCSEWPSRAGRATAAATPRTLRTRLATEQNPAVRASLVLAVAELAAPNADLRVAPWARTPLDRTRTAPRGPRVRRARLALHPRPDADGAKPGVVDPWDDLSDDLWA
ncbi:hypothetical protein ACFWWM_39650 [Streptomyces sp. NPDC058682]|uniref:hypothetical protein n=1 Tax=Streptomyces sp. NPDC058682 TaxID=3346596 RepID=UPI00365BB286